mgnify:CR=1 FL=1
MIAGGSVVGGSGSGGVGSIYDIDIPFTNSLNQDFAGNSWSIKSIPTLSNGRYQNTDNQNQVAIGLENTQDGLLAVGTSDFELTVDVMPTVQKTQVIIDSFRSLTLGGGLGWQL